MPSHAMPSHAKPCHAMPCPLQQAKSEIAGLADEVTATNAEVMREELLHHQVGEWYCCRYCCWYCSGTATNAEVMRG